MINIESVLNKKGYETKSKRNQYSNEGFVPKYIFILLNIKKKKEKAKQNSHGAQNSTPQYIRIIKYRKEASLQVTNIEALLYIKIRILLCNKI